MSRGSGGSSMEHMPGKFCHHLSEERDRSDENDQWRNIRGRDAIKRDAKRGD